MMKQPYLSVFCCLLFLCMILTNCGGKDDSEETFTPVWAEDWTPPRELLDFEAKAALLETGGGRLLSMAHRGDQVHYPENSLEGVLSCIAMGVDVAELDVRITKDNILVLSHDADLLRCTTLESAREENPGTFPESDRIRDWSYDELSRLYLLDNLQQPTPYRIPRLEDVIRACSGKMMILLDKMEEAAADAGMTEQELIRACLEPILAEYDSEPSCVKGWHFGRENMVALGDYAPYRHDEIAEKRDGDYQGKCIQASTLSWDMDREDIWADMDLAGVDLVMSNSPLSLVQYIAKTHLETD